MAFGKRPANWPCAGVFALSGRIISSDDAVGPATDIDTNAGFDWYRAARAVRKLRHAFLYTGFHGIGSSRMPRPSTKPAIVAFPHVLGGICTGDRSSPSQLGIWDITHWGV